MNDKKWRREKGNEAWKFPKTQPFGGKKNTKTNMTMGEFHQFEDYVVVVSKIFYLFKVLA